MSTSPTSEAARVSRRTFLRGSALAPFAGMMAHPIPPAQTHLRARQPGQREGAINCALIGYGPWGREIAATLGRLPDANVRWVCDTYDVMLRRAQRALGADVQTTTDYAQALADPDLHAVFVATPTHAHRQVVEDALAAGKNVYCEAPLAHTVEDARAIAQAAAAHPDQVFQAGLLGRTEPQHRSVREFIRSGAIGRAVKSRAQWHAKESWRRASPNREYEQAANWRLDPALSPGLLGEVGIQPIDVTNWILDAHPVAVTGFGHTMLWDDGRAVPDTVMAVFEYPGGVHFAFDATLASSFDEAYGLFHGSDSTIMLRDSKAWMFKEVDAPVLGWEVYARRDRFYKENGIALVANATQLAAQGVDPAAADPNVETPLYYALQEFMENNLYGPFPPSSDAQTAYAATAIALKAHEAVMQGGRVAIEPGLLALG